MADLKMKNAIADLDKAVVDFTNEMTFVINCVVNKNQRDWDIIEIRDGYLIAKREIPDCIIKKIGPYFWIYRETIKSGKVEPLLNNSFEKEIANEQKKLPEKFHTDKVQIIMGKIKRTWHLCTPLEQETLKKKFQNMLAYYATYTGACQMIEKLKA